ncbi:type I-E CRISPR-associated protein Cas6/Cse3/CasE [Erwinia pyrifoliae]|uniref:Type I-E CRISPR-associated protein Cas6/Cse3/CasE n=1 Tax=Erwinia pyrifoliae TaxID=79967 RepID=A0ABY5X5Q0_ERWPY|nr:type I-E CRISPR-associated protein Cas6/Cse3/CasE [Erwinia pyrifoliae]AUX73621.1 type I-E CRISPR-associated protein Cas6/Cse3/CasE [Erwinia pyrifoliae]MCA8876072.1 type I-E CRISPR-associated protein Cas6/Cse3/CasE [Erwinia pyrifoliae]UWS28587.1 type I-E CRISPR-associated protein Cas6/Cse3/CasE [Erwinia pyrifoliae]UWS32731.1 type I-E CRISPR-associated protein Cas6/Cse3/CasE [Erwinia pyrifoliae]UXK11580.1 type I-E CRISPR-associated protein Cas6/Cse3/CasE [Erwinia pyrifoliae]
MIYLSQIDVPWSWAKDPYQMHRALWQLFPDRPSDRRDFLFRVETRHAGSGQRVLLQSPQLPQNCAAAKVLASKVMHLNLSPGQRLHFRLRANPVKTIKDKRGRLNSRGEVKSCRVPLIDDNQLMQWLVRKLEGAAVLNSASVSKEPALCFNKQAVAGKIQPVCFEGILQVTSETHFYQCMADGIGPAKSMGCGMLSIARA